MAVPNFADLQGVEKWPQSIPTELDTSVYKSLGIPFYRDLVSEAEFLSALRSLCATHSYDLRVTGHPKDRSMCDVTVNIALRRDMVSATFARMSNLLADLSVSATIANPNNGPFFPRN
jgi:hypothetical protein